jgi:hypothetical protein
MTERAALDALFSERRRASRFRGFPPSTTNLETGSRREIRTRRNPFGKPLKSGDENGHFSSGFAYLSLHIFSKTTLAGMKEKSRRASENGYRCESMKESNTPG